MSKPSELLGRFLLVTVLGGMMLPSMLAAQFATAETFDINRFLDRGGDRYETFYVTDTQPLREVFEANTVNPDTRILVTETAAGNLALLTDQMAWHHIAQGNANGQDWMVTF